jgi:acyl-coenzyme A thioesterase PaaI-like protein
VSDAEKPDPDPSKDPQRWPYWSAQAVEATGAWAEKRRLATAMRAVIERLVTTDAPEDELHAAADALERYAARLERHPRRTRPVGFAESANAGSVVGFFDYSPLIGRSNPLAPPLTMGVDGKRVRGTAVFGAAYEGPPGHVHGGFVAAAFDEVLGFAQSMGGNPGMTGTLTIRYRKPTPLHREIRMEGEITRIEGRKIFTVGRMYAGEVLTAEAEGIFISVDLFKMRALADAAKR